jgi:hypothetical protein
MVNDGLTYLAQSPVNCNRSNLENIYMGSSMIPSTYEPTVLIIANDGDLWERDFLREIIPSKQENWHWIQVRPSRLKRVIHCIGRLVRDRGCVLVYSSNILSYPEIWIYTLALRPRILIHLSDEWGTKVNHTRLANSVGLVVRQYHHALYKEPPNVAYMPLGYMVGMLGDQSSTSLHDIPSITDRNHIWAFVGHPNKQDRKRALHYFSEWRTGVSAQNMTPPEMFDLYRNSIFVPSPRGNVRLDCFRLYEASLAGAIPVVAGSPEEIADTFCMEQDPPWIIADTWEQAIEKCQEELESPARLQERQTRLLAWWKSRVADVKLRIRRALTPDQ